ncbi:carboxypeptidase Taq [Palleronia marisminoris]|uniref:Metal-dependent carboxypeptidase n=1 Tax=Palleronia marisminoris TaxID=315423 RepID=A0A1Y5R731_9RHOB|nr:carboxypeptidase M32 [Palleronia marisminoris]SFG05423.1 carboxypeptidase Taq [Palleronia marisminoris]SLN10382.1 Thermostable carboxypeptidase 1 [Palleronia marisminoris]
MSAYDDLMAFQRETEALSQVAGRLGWDQETVMPRGAAEQRGEEMGVLEGILHARRIDPRIGDWLAAAEPTDPVAEANLRHIRRSFERTARVPARLASALARTTSVAQGKWAAARAADDFAAFAPVLAEIVALKREEAAALANGGAPYDALLDDYEPGATADTLSAMFGALRPRLIALRDACLGADRQPTRLDGTFPPDAQLMLSEKLAAAFGYDFNRGRIDRAVHPFSSGSGMDVRITTRTDPTDPFNCLYSTIHEVGHATYEQNIDDAYLFTPLGQGVSMGVHESQSRLYENQLGRSRAFTGWLHGQMTDTFGDPGMDPDAFFGTVNRLHKGYIRTEADEVQYNLHVLLRFDLERQLIGGTLDPADLDEAWNDRFKADFGYRPSRASEGCLQDVHWSVGLFGYFPTYSLGNVYAGCLYAALRRDLPDLDAALAAGDPRPATDWLRDRVQVHGGLYRPRDLIERATGEAPSEAPLLEYLEAKFGAIYGL